MRGKKFMNEIYWKSEILKYIIGKSASTIWILLNLSKFYSYSHQETLYFDVKSILKINNFVVCISLMAFAKINFCYVSAFSLTVMQNLYVCMSVCVCVYIYIYIYASLI